MILGFLIRVLVFFNIKRIGQFQLFSVTGSHVGAADGSLSGEIVIKMGMKWRKKKGLFVLNSGHFEKLCVPQTELVEHVYSHFTVRKSNQQQHAY